MGLCELGNHPVAVLVQTILRLVLPFVDLRLELIHLLPHLVDHLLLELAVFDLIFGVVSGVFLVESRSTWIALPDPDRDVLHLELVLTFLSLALEWLLTDRFNLVFQVDDDLAILLLPVDVILLLGDLGLLQLILFPHSF